jgi:hypothetical protein
MAMDDGSATSTFVFSGVTTPALVASTGGADVPALPGAFVGDGGFFAVADEVVGVEAGREACASLVATEVEVVVESGLLMGRW